ncbi:helix-turn-helix domain-containing protein (plasmid) [Alicyclobacillus fastidiosus]|uniref:Helix-turn-helix domain-containing protein n=1 Tax=Alicyclobacillus fastidiosus TaxID=392011 RepID=A0ABY6ZPU1_9BACL|nr:helix-turn-helix transcriptional regulator [Alicyclobacillus fastidiosus]WAH44862.1 helix-turn-helix domain-containing protein [Alicyclobacillus fastidiosus]GMA65617.1 hypothetical protein GCM10025859_60570 [Alicyclobacillus fastidiosus]GMA65834.1 hypothetical protein GCM10025859_62740 [Alicyclobacillus fastidiosus]
MRDIMVSEFRKVKGLTIAELSQKTGIDQARLYGIEEYRRRLTEEEATILASVLECTSDALLSDNQRFAMTEDVLEKFRNFGQIPYLGPSKAEPTINVLTDICHSLQESNVSMGHQVSEDSIRREILNDFVNARLSSAHDDMLSFPSTFSNGYEMSTCWVTVYRPPVMEKMTVVFEYIGGQSVINGAEWITEEFVKHWTNLPPKVNRKGRSFEEIRFIDLTYHFGEPNFTEVQIIDENAHFEQISFSPPGVVTEVYRTYRKTVPSSDLPDPVFRGVGDERCDSSRRGECPHNTKQIPSENSGCLSCRRTALTWTARMWLLNHFNDHELYRMDGFWGFEQLFPAEHETFVLEFEQSCKTLNETSLELFNRVQSWLGFRLGSEAIHVEGNEYTNGRHRASIAKAMGIASVPIIYSSTEQEDNYLIRE